MKKTLAIILALLLLLLTACGQASQPGSTQTPSEENAAPAEETAALSDEIFVDEYEMAGTKVKDYYQGGKDGILIRTEFTDPDGGYGVQEYFEDGTLSHMVYHGADGSVYDEEYYLSGSSKQCIVTNADGSYSEFHYADNGYYNTEEHCYYSGTMTYMKDVAADGTVTYELSSDFQFEEDGSYWQNNTMADGSVSDCHYRADGTIMEEHYTDGTTGLYSETTYDENGIVIYTFFDDPEYCTKSETEYYPNGNIKKMSTTHTDSDAFDITEYYENGFLKYEYYKHEDGTGSEDKYNEAGFLVYSHVIDLYGEFEYYGDEEGNLLKYVDNGTVYEGTAIPSWAVEGFQLMQEFVQERNAQMQENMSMEMESGNMDIE